MSRVVLGEKGIIVVPSLWPPTLLGSGSGPCVFAGPFTSLAPKTDSNTHRGSGVLAYRGLLLVLCRQSAFSTWNFVA